MTTEPTTYHVPVMLNETLDALDIKPEGTYVDVTFGGGGHSKAILQRLGQRGRLFSFDQDTDVCNHLPNDPRFTFVHGNFRFVRNFLRYYGVEHIDGLLADLGVSSHHFDEEERGFSFRFDGPLDMRMNQWATQTAATVVNNYTQEALAMLFRNYGELSQANRIAQKLVAARSTQPIETIGQLLETVRPLVSAKHEKKELAQIFQALRIEVNHELTALEELLHALPTILNPDGKAVFLTYHSLEDRMVKNFFKSGNIDGKVEKDFFGNVVAPLKTIGKQLVASDNEQAQNPRSRSARLRTATLNNNTNK
ncbi:MAG: 16S rRNA (cytosine(1402)-N(4))-methyltransferase RsmH [Bacteroidales bacterium]|nr:16S rRNA (cytosine(1402)-N(4))-methyltransferase RsmH [Bacteroidales bacterium]